MRCKILAVLPFLKVPSQTFAKSGGAKNLPERHFLLSEFGNSQDVKFLPCDHFPSQTFASFSALVKGMVES
jgi:hypothetical protein